MIIGGFFINIYKFMNKLSDVNCLYNERRSYGEEENAH